MRKGRKPGTPAEMRARGTYRPDRHGQLVVEHLAPGGPPIAPDWLTEAGREVWHTERPRAMRAGFATETDSTAFASFCNLAGALTMAWRAGDVPPVSAVREVRIEAEAFGLAGYLSRLQAKP